MEGKDHEQVQKEGMNAVRAACPSAGTEAQAFNTKRSSTLVKVSYHSSTTASLDDRLEITSASKPTISRMAVVNLYAFHCIHYVWQTIAPRKTSSHNTTTRSQRREGFLPIFLVLQLPALHSTTQETLFVLRSAGRISPHCQVKSSPPPSRMGFPVRPLPVWLCTPGGGGTFTIICTYTHRRRGTSNTCSQESNVESCTPRWCCLSKLLLISNCYGGLKKKLKSRFLYLRVGLPLASAVGKAVETDQLCMIVLSSTRLGHSSSS